MHSFSSSSKLSSLSLSLSLSLSPVCSSSFFKELLQVCLFGLCFWQEAKQQQQAAQGQ
jgi:hypothetical protein